MRWSNYKHRESIVFLLSLHLPSIATTKRPILKPGCFFFLCWFGWYCLTPSNNTIEKDGRSERGHLPTGTVTTNIKTTFTNTTRMVPYAIQKKTGFTKKKKKKPIGATTMMSAINSKKKRCRCIDEYSNNCLLKHHWPKQWMMNAWYKP